MIEEPEAENKDTTEVLHTSPETDNAAGDYSNKHSAAKQDALVSMFANLPLNPHETSMSGYQSSARTSKQPIVDQNEPLITLNESTLTETDLKGDSGLSMQKMKKLKLCKSP